jgi:hypothetical protein
MSSYGMLGLLEGMGKGTQEIGKAMERTALQEAEERRQTNLLKIKRTWDREDAVTDRENHNTDQIAAETRKNALDAQNSTFDQQQEDSRYTRARTDKLEDQKALSAQEDTRDANRQRMTQENAKYANELPGELEKKLAFVQGQVKSGALTKEQGDRAVEAINGISKDNIGGKDRVEIRVKAFAQSEKESKADVDAGNPPWTPAKINARASELEGHYMGLLETGPSASAQLARPLDTKSIKGFAEQLAAKTPEETSSLLAEQEKAGKMSASDSAKIAESAQALRNRKSTESKMEIDPTTGEPVETNTKRLAAIAEAKAKKEEEDARRTTRGLRNIEAQINNGSFGQGQ